MTETLGSQIIKPVLESISFFFLTIDFLFFTLPYVLINDTTGTKYLNKFLTKLWYL